MRTLLCSAFALALMAPVLGRASTDTPPNDAPMAKAMSLRLRVLMPMALAAISSSRMAIQARPMRESCRR